MEIIRNCAGWYIHACWSDKAVIGAAMIAVIAVIVYGLAKMSWSWFRIGSPWKIFRKIIFFVVIGGLIYSYYPKITLKLQLWMVERAQLAKAIKPLKKRLDDLGNKARSGEEGLTDAEAVERQLLEKDIRAAGKKVKEGPLSQTNQFQPQAELVARCKWVFGFTAELSQIINAAKRGINQAAAAEEEIIIDKEHSLSITGKEVRFSYKKSGKKRRVLLERALGDQYYHGIIDLPDGRKLLIWLKEDPILPDSFVGIVQNWDGVQEYPPVDAYLKKICR